jgi:hypothetical protein
MVSSQRSNPDCSSVSPKSSDLKRCGRCLKATYCSRACQVASWAAHKKQWHRQNYIVSFQLASNDISDPPVERTLSCPANAPFYALHLALQLAFGWATTHSFDFAVLNPDYREPEDMVAFIQRTMQLSQLGGMAASDP